MEKKFVTKLGPARKVPLSRIWIEGKRLVEAGFTVGQHFIKELEVEAPKLTLTILGPDDVLNTAPCKVSGKGDKPIIDITGEMVRGVFGKRCTHVVVTYGQGVIEIEPSPEHQV